MKNLRFGFIIFLLLLGFGLGLWWIFATDSDDTLAQIRQNGTLRVGLDASFPPFENFNPTTNQIEGLDVDLAQAIATDLGVKVELVNIGFDGLYDALLARRVDMVISGLPYDPRQTEDVAYTINYFNGGQLLLVQKGNNQPTSTKDLVNRTVAVEWGSQAEMSGRQLSQKIAGLTLLRQPTAEKAIDALLNGEVEAAIVDGVSGCQAMFKGLKIVTYLTDEWYVGAVRHDSSQLLEAINRTLTRLEKSGEMNKIKENWCR